MYNGRQITQMRFRDTRELEKYTFLSGRFNFGTEVLENASKDKEYAKLINIMKKANNTDNKPIILYDIPNQSLYIGNYSSTGMFLYQVVSANELEGIDIAYEPKTDKMTINDYQEEILSTDNVKTLFGTESIIGSGNIDLFIHFLTLTAADGSVLYINFPSSNKLECDSLQDLTTMTKATKTSGTKIGFGSKYIIYDSTGIWKTANNTMITKVEDKVFTI